MAEDVVDVLAAGNVDEAGTVRLAHHEGQLARDGVAAEDAAGEKAASPFEKRFFLWFATCG